MWVQWPGECKFDTYEYVTMIILLHPCLEPHNNHGIHEANPLFWGPAHSVCILDVRLAGWWFEFTGALGLVACEPRSGLDHEIDDQYCVVVDEFSESSNDGKMMSRA